MRQLLGLVLGLAALVAGFFFTWIIVAVLLVVIALLLSIMVLRRLWFKLSGRQPAPLFVFRHHSHQAAYHPARDAENQTTGRTIDVTAESTNDAENAKRIEP